MKFLKEGLGPFPKGEIVGEDGKPKEVILDDEMNSVEGTDREKKIEDLISRWDTSGLTKEFTAQLMALIDKVGWDNSNPFLNWLQVANDKNIQYLDRTSSKALIKALNEDDMKQTHLVNDNNLFSGNPKEFEYKLNLVRILEDPKEASKFKNDSGETPRIDMIMEKGNFVDASEMKLRMDQFASDEYDTTSLRNWFDDNNYRDAKKQYSFLDGILKNYYKDEKKYPKWASGLYNIFYKDNSKYNKLLNDCDININTTSQDIEDIINSLNEYFNSIGDLNFTTKYNKLIDALNIKGLGGENAYKFLRDTLNKSKYKSDIPIFNKLWTDKKYREDMLISPISSDSKGNIAWSHFIHKYITNSDLPADILGTTSKILGVDGAPIKK